MKTRSAVSMRDLAALAGVSHVTVSRALRNDPHISPETSRRIHELAAAQGYRPNPLVSALMTQLRSTQPRIFRPTIAFINSFWPKPAWEVHETYIQMFRGAQERGAELGYNVEPFWLNAPGMTAARLGQILHTRRIQGALVGPLPGAARFSAFPWSEFTVATLGYSLRDPDIPRACHAHYRAVNRVMTEAVAHGCRRIAYITSADMEHRVNSLWEAAFRCQQARLPKRDRIEPLFFQGEPEISRVEAWIRKCRPHVVLTGLGLVSDWLEAARHSEFADVGLVSLNVLPRAKRSGVSGIDQISGVVGASAIDLVISQLNLNARGTPRHPITQIVEGNWVPGHTLVRHRASVARE